MCAPVQDAYSLLLTMGGATSRAAPSKAAALDGLMQLEGPQREALLDSALELLASSKRSKLARWRLPVRLPSKRATIGSFRRLLEQLEED